MIVDGVLGSQVARAMVGASSDVADADSVAEPGTLAAGVEARVAQARETFAAGLAGRVRDGREPAAARQAMIEVPLSFEGAFVGTRRPVAPHGRTRIAPPRSPHASARSFDGRAN